MLKNKTISAITVLLLIVFMISSAVEASDNTAGIKDGIVIYYFHGNQRCVTCKNIEKLSKAATERKFPEGLKDGTVKFIPINVETSDNEHFINDYQLFVRSVVVTRIENGKETSWTKLDKVWQYHKDPETFLDYFDSETDKLLGGK